MKLYHKILVPIDGSKPADKALMTSIEMAQRNGSTINIVTVIDDFKNFTAIQSFGAVTEVLIDTAQQLLEDAVNKAKAAGVEEVHAEILRGDPRSAIVDYQKENGNDLMVIGASGKGNIQRMLLGSVSEYALLNTSCNVLVMH